MSSNTPSNARVTGWTSQIFIAMIVVIIVGISVLIVEKVRTIDQDYTNVSGVLEHLMSEQVGQELP